MTTSIFKKATQLRELQRRATTQGECKAATRVLARYLEKYRLSMAEIDLHKKEDLGVTIDTDNPLYSWKRKSLWRRYLIEVLCNHFGVATFIGSKKLPNDKRGKKIEKRIYLCGTESDIDLVREMFSWLQLEIKRIRLDQKDRSTKSLEFWSLGFVLGVKEQLQAAQDDTWSHVASGAQIVLRNRSGKAWEHLKNEIAPEQSEPEHKLKINDVVAFGRGHSTGKDFHIGKSLGQKEN